MELAAVFVKTFIDDFEDWIVDTVNASWVDNGFIVCTGDDIIAWNDDDVTG